MNRILITLGCTLFVALHAALAFPSDDMAIKVVNAFGKTQPPKEQPPKTDAPLPTENDALVLAAIDLKGLPVEEQVYTRYVWVRSGVYYDAQAIYSALNHISRGSIIIRPIPLGKDKLIVLRFNIRWYAPKDQDYQEWSDTFEELSFDPRFSLLLTKDLLGAGGKTPKANPNDFKVPEQKKGAKESALDRFDPTMPIKGETFEQHAKRLKDYNAEREVQKVFVTKEPIDTYFNRLKAATLKSLEAKSGGNDDNHPVAFVQDKKVPKAEQNPDVVKVVSGHLDIAAWTYLTETTGSQAPVVSHDYFLSRALSQIQNKGIAKTIYGGLYYRFIGLPVKSKKGTDLDNLFAKLGVGDVATAKTAKAVFDNLRSDQRVAIFQSQVTGRGRRIDFMRTLAGRIGDTQSIISVTHDLNTESIDLGQDPIANLIDFKASGFEVIWELPNALHGFAAYNGEEAAVDQVPDNITHDHLVPSPYPSPLEPARSCITCHGSESGWKKVRNDAKELITKYLDVLDDNAGAKLKLPEVINRLGSLYGGDVEKTLLPRGRDDYAASSLLATGPFLLDPSDPKKGAKELTKAAIDMSAQITSVYSDYNWKTIDAQAALRDLGVEASKQEAPAMFLKLVTPKQEKGALGFVPESPRIGALGIGLALTRPQYDLEYSSIATRAALTKTAKK